MKLSQNSDAGVDAGEHRPVLFLHIPKTAGTSFILTLQNMFGDNRVRRIRQVNAGTPHIFDNLVGNELGSISCVTGHLPIHMVEPWLDRLRPFTILREPVARVLSLYRFLKISTPEEFKRLSLSPDFSLADFLGSRHPEIYSQTNNGMVRMLSGEVELSDPDFREFHNMDAVPAALGKAVANLERMEFGLSEEMGPTLTMIQAGWSIPYPMRELRENTTRPDPAGEDVRDIYEIIARNTMDLALYRRANAIFHVRVAALRAATASSAVSRLAVFDPPHNQVVSVGDVSGRQGFHEFESEGIAWLRADQPAEIRFVSSPDLIRLRLHIYCITESYPVADVALTVNERPLNFIATAAKNKWYYLETDHFDTMEGINRITIKPPVFIPVRELAPGTQDERRLGIALGDIVVGP